MEFSKLKMIEKDDYKDFVNKIEKVKELLKENKKYSNLYESFDFLNNKRIYLYLLLFKNYEKWINLHFTNNYNNIDSNNFHIIVRLLKIKNTINIKDKKFNWCSLFITWKLYMYVKFIRHFYAFPNPNYSEVNKIRYLLRETNNIIVKLYKLNIFNTSQLFIIMNSSIFLIETNFDIKSYSDKLYKTKNYLLLQGLFFLLQEISVIIINKVNLNLKKEEKENKANVSKIFTFLEEFKNNKEINMQINMMVLIHNNLINSYLNRILDIIDIKIMEKFEPKFKKNLMDFFSFFFKFNYKKSKIYNTFLNSLKQSFTNLYNFEKNKNKIMHDLFKNSFYIKLLKKIFYSNDNKSERRARLLYDTFYFNGFDSQISLNVQNNTFEKSTLFFSFYLSPLKQKNQYPLFVMQKDFDRKKTDLLYIYLKINKENNCEVYDLYISIEGKEKKMERIPKIKPYTTYYFSLCFNISKLLINFCERKEDIYSTEIGKKDKLLAINSISLAFGFYKKRVFVFSGYIGPIIMIRNPKNSKDLNTFISSVLKLESNYRNYIYLNKNTNYISEEEISFKKNNNYELDYKLEKLDFIIYLMPDIFRFFNDKSRVVNHLPNIDCICKYQKSFNIYNLNVTLIKHEQGIIDFIMDNGLNYICLIYEYIYQFYQYYLRDEVKDNKDYQSDKEIFRKMIFSIIKKTLFIIENSYKEITLIIFNKPLKQLYMNLFSIIKLIRKDSYFIIHDLIGYFFNIIKYYHDYISNYIKKRKLYTFETINSKNNEILNDNNLQINLSCINGWLDFLLDPQLYDFNKKEAILKLFNELSCLFSYLKLNNSKEKINQNLYLKLLSFIPYLNLFYNQKDLDDKENKHNKDKECNGKENGNNIIENEKDILDIYFNVLKRFFENNPSKSENILNLKNLFKNVSEYLSESNQAYHKFNYFINELITDKPDLYFSDDKNDKQIKLFIKYAKKFSLDSKENLEVKNENETNNKKDLFYKLILILIRLIFTKKRKGRNDKIIGNFKKLLSKVEKTRDLMITISNEIINIFNHIFIMKNDNNAKEQNKKKCDIYEKDYLDKLSSFYSDIFDLILFFLEYPIDNNDGNTFNSKEKEKMIIGLLVTITNLIKSIIENDYKFNNNITNSISSEDDESFLDIIYCLINFLKFYNNIFFNKVYSKKFIENFVEICELCNKICLVNYNILIEIEIKEYEYYSLIEKTPLEIILDICIFYITLTSNKYNENLFDDEINRDTLIEEQRIIYNFLCNLFFPKYNDDSKEKKNKYSIFFINDYLRFLSTTYPFNGKKKPKNDQFFSLFAKEFNIIQILDKLLFEEQKYNYNFTTFFILKGNGYKKILVELNIKIDSKLKDNLKCDDALTLMMSIIQKIYLEHEILYSKNKQFFFNSKKANTSYQLYSEIKKLIESNLKKNNYLEIDNYILENKFKENYDKIYNSIYSGCCVSKKKSEHRLSEADKLAPKSKFNPLRHAISSTNVIIEALKEGYMERTLSDTKKEKKPLVKSVSIKSQGGGGNNSNSEKDSSITQEEENDLELDIKEIPTSGNNKIGYDENLDLGPTSINSDYSSPLVKDYKNLSERKQTINSDFSLSVNIELSEKKAKNTRTFSMISELSIESNGGEISTYINYFDEPDGSYITNAKKELMMTVFSVYFFDLFFINEDFKLMKNYYLQNFEGIQKSTKLLDYPSKIKAFNNGLEPNLFLKPFTSFFYHKFFPISHQYFYNYLENNDFQRHEPIILFKKILPDIYLEEKFDKKCELIKIDRSYYGHIIGSKNINYIIFEQKKYDFYDDISESNKSKEGNFDQQNDRDLNDLFTLSNVSKKPFNKARRKSISKNEKFNKIKKFKGNKTLIILFDEIEEIVERRFLLMWQAIEIFLKNGKSYFFNLISKEELDFIIDIFKNNKITKNKVHFKDYFKTFQKKLFLEWQEERLSTYEYLLLLNKFSSRSFNDVNQYPIFPWLIRKYVKEKGEADIKVLYRDFKYPMASQIEENRISAINRYEDDEESGVKFPIHYGTHYSTSSYIYFYLMREEPYTTLLEKLQGYKQENPDRMFFSLFDTLFVLETGSDNRECIPDIFCKIEQFINLNCVDFGKKNNGLRVDDFIIDNYSNNLIGDENNNNFINNYVQFIFDNQKLLDEKIISNNISDWFDIIFGIGQLPEKNMKKSLNIFNKATYEQKINLHEKLLKMRKKYKEEEVIKKIENKIDLIISFGQTPYQIFNEKHPKNEKKKRNKEVINLDEDEEDLEDFESSLKYFIWEKDIKGAIETLPIYFEINSSLGMVFLIDTKRQLEIIDSNYYDVNVNSKKHFYFNKIGVRQLSHIKFFEKIKINDNYSYYIIKIKYSFSSFNEKSNAINNNLNNNEYTSYYNSFINNLCAENSKQDSKKGKGANKEIYLRFVTCRYMDNSFKIHHILKNKPKNEEKPISIVCEDFVTSCCTINHNQFIIGLKNGKLIQWTIENELTEDISSKNLNLNYQLRLDKQIQAHKKSINVIEINRKLGILITAGEDNYVFIRKLYDFELLTPIRINSKYIITMAKVSPMNFLYIMCCNKKKKKNKSVIFGYTLNGLYFAKSKYGSYDNIDFTRNGNIVSYVGKKEIEVLSGNDLNNIIQKDDKFMNEVQKKISGASWIKFMFYSRKNDIEPIINKNITFTIFDKSKGGNLIQTLDVTNISSFD